MTPKEKAQAIDAMFEARTAIARGEATAVETLEKLARSSSTLAWCIAISTHFVYTLNSCGATPVPGTSKEEGERARENMAQLMVDCYTAGFIAALEVKP